MVDGDGKDESLLDQLKRTRHYKLFLQELHDRRERILRMRPKTNEELWIKEGRLQEVTEWIGGPHLIREVFRRQRVAERKVADRPDGVTSGLVPEHGSEPDEL